MCRYLVYNLMNEIHYNWIWNFHRLRIWLQSKWHWPGFLMDTDLLIANRINERLSVERSLHDINTGIQNQRLVAYPVMLYRWYGCPTKIFNNVKFKNGNSTMEIQQCDRSCTEVNSNWNGFTSDVWINGFYSELKCYHTE